MLELRNCVRLTSMALRSIAVTMLIAASCVPAGNACADVRATVTATDPAGEAIELARDQALYVRIDYATDTAVSIWARPYFKGKEVSAKTNASIHHDGKGQALGWFSLDRPGEVDEVRILAGDGTRTGTHQVASLPLKVVATNGTAAAGARADWVETLSREEERVRRQDYEKRMNEPSSAGESLFMSGFMLAVLALLAGGFAWPAWAMWKWGGGWRVASAIPLVLMGVVVLRIVFDTSRDPTSHNLWPFEILIWGSVSLLAMLVLKIVRRFARVEP